MSDITLIGIDTAKTIFHLYAVNQYGSKIYQKSLRRPQLLPFLAQQQAATVAMEACSGTHWWARQIKSLGHTVKLISTLRVSQFGTRNKNDFNDAKAITKAARDPDTYYVPVKNAYQQTVQAIHKLRDRTMRQRTAEINGIRALLVEFGVIIPKGVNQLIKAVPSILEDADIDLPFEIRELLQGQLTLLRHLNKRLADYDHRVKAHLKDNATAKRLQSIPGVGPLISTALECMIADPSIFKNGRHCAAWVGLTPKEHSTGGKQRLGRVSCEGNAYLRKLLVQGAQAMLINAHKRNDRLSIWASKLKESKGCCVAAIAVANKIVRIAWAMMHTGQAYQYEKACQLHQSAQ